MTLVEWFEAVPERPVGQVVRTFRDRTREAADRTRRRLRLMGPQLTCALLLVGVLACTGLLVWLCWHTAADARLRPAESSTRETTRLETSLLAEQRQERSTSRKGVPAAGTDAAPTAPRSQGGATVPASVLASVGSAAAVAAGAAAGLLVLRRFRRREEEAVEAPLLAVTAEREQDEREEPDPLGERAQPEQDRRTTPAARAVETTEPAWARAGLVGSPAVAPLQLRGLGDGGSAASGSLDEHRPPAEGQRLFERRAVPRVDYTQEAVLLLGEQTWDVRTLNLSEKGLGCRAAAPAEGAAAGALPKPLTNVRVRLPLDGGLVELRAQVVWRRRTKAGQEAGLTFSGLTDAQHELLRRTCAALTPAP